MLKTTKLFYILTIRVFELSDNKVVRGNNSSKADKTVKNLLKFKKSKNNKYKNLAYVLSI